MANVHGHHAVVGAAVGASVFAVAGAIGVVGETVGVATQGDMADVHGHHVVGATVGAAVGASVVGGAVGATVVVGATVGVAVSVGAAAGASVVGATVGAAGVGAAVGATVGATVVGATVGAAVEAAGVGAAGVGATVGAAGVGAATGREPMTGGGYTKQAKPGGVHDSGGKPVEITDADKVVEEGCSALPAQLAPKLKLARHDDPLARFAKIVNGAEPLTLRETIFKIQHEDLIQDRDDLKALAESMFRIVMEPEITKHEPDDRTGHDSRYARLGEVLCEMNVLLRLELPQFCECGKKLSKDNRCCLKAEQKPVTYTRIVLDCVQQEFESLMQKFAKAEKNGTVTKELEHKLHANVTLIGRLYVRKLVAARVIAQVVAETIGVSERQPHPGCIRCVCELLVVIGHFMEDSKPGEALMGQFITRLDSLKELTNPNTHLKIYDESIRDTVKEMKQARADRWPPLINHRALLQYETVDWKKAELGWQALYDRHALPPDEMHRKREDGPPPGEQEKQPEHVNLIIKSLISGRTVAVACSQNLELLTQPKTALNFPELISTQTGIYWRRILLFDKEMTPLEVPTVA